MPRSSSCTPTSFAVPAARATAGQRPRGSHRVQKSTEGLIRKTVRNINQVISSAMDFAVAQRFLAENPCKAVALPKLEHKEMQTIGGAIGRLSR
jgi:hypothetical protein